MKKILTLSIMMACALHALAQLTIIPKAGMTLSKMAVAEDFQDDIKSTMGFTVGAAINYALNDKISLQPELSFIQKGYKTKEVMSDGGSTFTTEANVHINYVELPVLVKASFGADNLRLFLNAGPSFGFGLGGKAKVEMTLSGSGSSFSETEEYKVKFGDEEESSDEIYYDNRLDIGVQLGGGVIIAKKVMVDIRYGLGLTNLVDKEVDMTDDDAKSKSRVFQFTVGIPIQR